MAYKTRRERRAGGGKAETEPLRPEHGNQYNAQGSPEEKEESAKSDGFRRGGPAKRKAGGHVDGAEAKQHLGRRARGGRAMASGGAPFSSAHNTEPPGNKKDSGPGEQAPMIP